MPGHPNPGDNMLNSVWSAQAAYPVFRRLEQDLKTDVLIIGGGMAGLLCAGRLAREGVDYALIEADRICHGISRNTTAKITSQHGLIYDRLIREFDADAARLYFEANEAALREFRKLAKGNPCDLETKDNYIYSIAGPAKLEREMGALERISAGADFVEALPLPFSVTGAIRFRAQAQFHPVKFAAEIARGLNIYEKTSARTFEGNVVVTDRGRIRAGKIIVATHFPMLNKHGSYFLKLYQDRSYVLALENAGKVDGMYLDEAAVGLSFRNYGNLLLLGGGSHRTGKQGSGWTEMEAFAKKHYPGAKITHRWAAQDCMTLDGIPYIGQYSKRTPNLYVATGFNKWGMTSAMAASMILGDLVQGRENPWASLFDPSRTMLRRQLVVNGFESALHLLTPTRPRCPHLGCALKWNSQEHSWDCPCHGSRFAKDGKLLDGPSTGDLKGKN